MNCRKCGAKRITKRRAGFFSCRHCGIQPNLNRMDRGGLPIPPKPAPGGPEPGLTLENETMKLLAISALLMAASIGSASALSPPQCKQIGNSSNYRCEGDGKAYTVSNANSATAAAAAIQGQAQNQNQGQSQNSENFNANNNEVDNRNSNSVNFEGNPAHTTSFNVGVGVSVRLGEGVRARAVQDAADWLADNGQKCLAVQSMLKLHPDLKRMGKTVAC